MHGAFFPLYSVLVSFSKVKYCVLFLEKRGQTAENSELQKASVRKIKGLQI